MKPKILVILGPTATGKSDLAVRLGRKYNGEIISADSRQVYKSLDIGTGKITKKEMMGIPHHMLDVISPKKVFSVSLWKRIAEEKIQDILSRNKLPIICGGTGLYIQSVVDGVVFPEVPPDFVFRKKLEKKSVQELFTMLKKLDPRRAGEIEKENPVRLIRAIEIAIYLGNVPKMTKEKSPYDTLQIGLTLPEKDLKQRIHTRLISRMKKGMAREAQNLHASGLSWKRMRELGLEYRYLADFLQKRIFKQELNGLMERGIWDYVKRQMTWFKRDRQIKWHSPSDIRKITKEVAKFLGLSYP